MEQADATWNNDPKLIDEQGEVRELTENDAELFRPFRELPAELQTTLLALQRGPVTFKACKETVDVPVSK